MGSECAMLLAMELELDFGTSDDIAARHSGASGTTLFQRCLYGFDLVKHIPKYITPKRLSFTKGGAKIRSLFA